MTVQFFFKACKWALIALAIFTVYYFGSAVLDSLPKIANMYK